LAAALHVAREIEQARAAGGIEALRRWQ